MQVFFSCLNRDHRTIKKIGLNLASFSGRSDKGKPRGNSIVSPRMVKRMKREIRRNPLQTSKEILILSQLVYQIRPKVQDVIS